MPWWYQAFAVKQHSLWPKVLGTDSIGKENNPETNFWGERKEKTSCINYVKGSKEDVSVSAILTLEPLVDKDKALYILWLDGGEV